MLGDLINHINEYGDTKESYWQIRRDYKTIPWNPERYQTLLAQFKEARWVVYGLVIELTKAANWVIRMVVSELDSLYRHDEGMILLFTGDLFTGELFIRAEYASSACVREGLPYIGIERIWSIVRYMNGQLDWEALLRPDDDC